MNRTWTQDIGEVLRTAWPLMLSTGLFSLTLFVDRMLLFHYKDGAAGAAMAAGTLFWSVTCLPIGICGYTSTFVSQYIGVRRLDRALHVVWQGLLLGLCMGPILILLGLFSKSFFLANGHSDELATAESAFFCWLIPGAWSTVMGAALVGLFAGSGRTVVLLYCDAAVTVLNGVLDYGLIFGHFGFPELGVAGAALASSIALTMKLVLLVFFAVRYLRAGAFGQLFVQTSESPAIRTTKSEPSEGLWNELRPLMTFEAGLMKRLVRFGWPAGVSVVAEAWSFTIIMMIVGTLGKLPADATTLALGVNLIAFIPLVGLGTAVGVLVGKYLVQSDIRSAKRMAQSGLMIGVAYSSIFVVFYGGFPEAAINVYSIGADQERFDEMRPLLKPLLYFIAAYCVFDAFQTVFVGVLKGAGDTMYVLLGHLFAGATTVIGGILVSYVYQVNNLYYWWAVISVWVVLLAIVFTARYLQGGWQSKRVIEPTLIEPTLVATQTT